MDKFETWWKREGQEFLFALNTTTDDDIKLVAEIAWKNGAYCAEQAEQEPIFSSKCPKCSHKVISTHSADLWWCNKCLHEWPFNKQSEKQSVSQEVKELRQQVAALKAVLDAWNNVEQVPVAEVVLRSCKVGFGRTEERKDIVFLSDVEVGTKLYAAPVRTKDLTDDEINKAWESIDYFKPYSQIRIDAARAVIAAYKENNK